MKLTEAFKLIAVIFLTVAVLTGCSKEEREKRKAARLLNEIREALQKDNFDEVVQKSLFIIKFRDHQQALFMQVARSALSFPVEFTPLNELHKKIFLKYMTETNPTKRLNAEYFKFDKIVDFKMNGNRYILKTIVSYKYPFTGQILEQESYYCFLKKEDKVYLLLEMELDSSGNTSVNPLYEQILSESELFFGEQIFGLFYKNAVYNLPKNLLPISRSIWFEKGTEGINETLRPIIAKENSIWSKNTDLGGGDSTDKSNHETEYKLACEKANKKDCESECCELFRKGELAKNVTLKMCFETLCK